MSVTTNGAPSWLPVLPYRLYELLMLTPDGLVRHVRVRDRSAELAADLVAQHFPDWEVWAIHCWTGSEWVDG